MRNDPSEEACPRLLRRLQSPRGGGWHSPSGTSSLRRAAGCDRGSSRRCCSACCATRLARTRWRDDPRNRRALCGDRLRAAVPFRLHRRRHVPPPLVPAFGYSPPASIDRARLRALALRKEPAPAWVAAGWLRSPRRWPRADAAAGEERGACRARRGRWLRTNAVEQAPWRHRRAASPVRNVRPWCSTRRRRRDSSPAAAGRALPDRGRR